MTDEPGGGRHLHPTSLSRVWHVLRIALLVWLGMVAILALSQHSMIYHPAREEAVSLARLARSSGFEPWTNEQGEVIGYRSLPANDDPRPSLAILITHGNAGHALHRAAYLPILRAAKPAHAVAVYILEYPGYGARSGIPSQSSFLEAAKEAIGQIPKDSSLVLLGESIGTGVASATAGAYPERVTGVLLLTPFDTLANVASYHYPLLPVRWIMRDQYPAGEWLTNYHGPVAMILAGKDTIVPAKLGKALYDKYSGPKKLTVAERADHNDLLHNLSPDIWHQNLAFLLGK